MTITSTDNPRITNLDPNDERYATFPPLAAELLLNLIEWAEADQRVVDTGKFEGWGHWDQSLWSSLPATNLVPGGARYADPTLEPGINGSINLTPEQRASIQHEIEGGACGTSYCMAGQAVSLSGRRLLYVGDRERLAADYCVRIEETGEIDERGRPVTRDVGEPVLVSQEGQRVLGLHYRESGALFGGENKIDDLKRITNWIFANRDLPHPFAGMGIQTNEADEPDEDDDDTY